jgi:hypothetical protein
MGGFLRTWNLGHPQGSRGLDRLERLLEDSDAFNSVRQSKSTFRDSDQC